MKIHIKDVLKSIKQLNNYSQNLIFSDPPYNLGSKIYIDPEDGKMKFKGKAQDFMNKWSFGHKQWEEFFVEAFRILKYGGYCILFSMDRQLSLISYYAQAAGFEVQQSLYWYNIQGFPKATDAGKVIDKRLNKERKIVGINPSSRPNSKKKGEKGFDSQVHRNKGSAGLQYFTESASDLAKRFDGYKYSVSPFKQALETIMVFKKPTKNKSVLDDLFEYSEGNEEISPSVINIDDARISTDKLKESKRGSGIFKTGGATSGWNKDSYNGNYTPNRNGRYPSQLIIDKNASKVINEQSGILKSGSNCIRTKPGNGYHGNMGKAGDKQITYGDEGGASRICNICQYENREMDLLHYCPKVSTKERNAGLNKLDIKSKNYSHDGRKTLSETPHQRHSLVSKNNHPTLKPISLNRHIMTLFKLPDEIDQKIYIPFAGVFSEVIGAYQAGFKTKNMTVCEIDKKYVCIGKARFLHWRGKKVIVK